MHRSLRLAVKCLNAGGAGEKRVLRCAQDDKAWGLKDQGEGILGCARDHKCCDGRKVSGRSGSFAALRMTTALNIAELLHPDGDAPLT